MKLLRQEQMLEKINAKYKSNLTLEDVLDKIKFVNRFKMPFLIINIIAYALSVITFVLIGVNSEFSLMLIYIWSAFLTVVFFMEAIGFLYFGRRLVNVLPDNVRDKMKRVRMEMYIYLSIYLSIYLNLFCSIHLSIYRILCILVYRHLYILTHLSS